MNIASVREAIAFANNQNLITPYLLGQVLGSYATQDYVAEAISKASIDPSTIDLSSYAKKTDLPTKLSQLTNDGNYVATINGVIPSTYLPSYVDDVLEYESTTSFPNPGTTGKIYVAKDTNKTYRWGGSDYVEISESLALGTTEESAYRGDYGQIAYEHSQEIGNPHNLNILNLGITASLDDINSLTGLFTGEGSMVELLSEKLNISGGTMTGPLILYRSPEGTFEAATKGYVDTVIDGISVTVDQKISSSVNELADALGERLELQADTITEVKNKVEAVESTTESITTIVSQVETDLNSTKDTLTETRETLTSYEASVNWLEAELEKYSTVIITDNNNIPYDATTIIIPFKVLYKNKSVNGDPLLTIETNHSISGVSITVQETYIQVDVANSVALHDSDITIDFIYTDLIQYKRTRVFSIQSLKQTDIAMTFTHIKYTNNIDIEDIVMTDEIESDTLYVGINLSTYSTPSEDPSDYNWIQFTDVEPGETTYYTHKKYSNDKITFTPAEDESSEEGTVIGRYYGIAVTQSETAPTNVSDYTWFDSSADLEDIINITIDELTKFQNEINKTLYGSDTSNPIFLTKEEVSRTIEDSINNWSRTQYETGGENLLRNTSLAYTHYQKNIVEPFDDILVLDVWEKMNEDEWNYIIPSECKVDDFFNAVSSTAMKLIKGNTLHQTQKVINTNISLSFRYRKPEGIPASLPSVSYNGVTETLGTEKVLVNSIDEDETPNETVDDRPSFIHRIEEIKDGYEYWYFADTFAVTNTSLDIAFTSPEDTVDFLIYDLMANYGDTYYRPYTQNMNEAKTTSISLGEELTVESKTDETKVSLGTQGLIGRNKNTEEIIFRLTKTGTVTKDIQAESGTIGGLSIFKQEDQSWIIGV